MAGVIKRWLYEDRVADLWCAIRVARPRIFEILECHQMNKLFLNVQAAAPVHLPTSFGGIIAVGSVKFTVIQRAGRGRLMRTAWGHDRAYWSVVSANGESRSIV
jgi:hypothetical protein